MAELKKIHIPNIGDFDSVEVIEIMVKVGDKIKVKLQSAFPSEKKIDFVLVK